MKKIILFIVLTLSLSFFTLYMAEASNSIQAVETFRLASSGTTVGGGTFRHTDMFCNYEYSYTYEVTATTNSTSGSSAIHWDKLRFTLGKQGDTTVYRNRAYLTDQHNGDTWRYDETYCNDVETGVTININRTIGYSRFNQPHIEHQLMGSGLCPNQSWCVNDDILFLEIGE